MPYDAKQLDDVFGAGSEGDVSTRARLSSRSFVRGLDLLTFDESAKAKGRRLTALEALEAYGLAALIEVATEGAAVISSSTNAVGRVLRQRRADLGLETGYVASAAGLRPEVVEALERSARRPVREYERVARVLGLDERMLSFRGEPVGNQDIAVRMRTLHDDKPALRGAVVAALSEASWVAMTQVRLESALSLPGPDVTFDQEGFYGSGAIPAFRVGYDLADRLRSKLGLDDAPIDSMRELMERRLRIPIVQAELGDQLAGATIVSGDRRAVVVNLSGRNRNVFVRRSTLAHELCHILFDPREQLRDLRVDEYDDLERREDQVPDPVEQRANAFAVQLLLPRAVAKERHSRAQADALLQLIERFGVSFTAARYQIWNSMERAFPLEGCRVSREPVAADWEGREAYTATWHPIPSLVGHPSRAGRFSAVVYRAAKDCLVSWDTAAEWLYSSENELRSDAVSTAMMELYPDLLA